MQIIRPDTLPFIQVFITLFLLIVAVLGLVLFNFGIKNRKRNKRKIHSISAIVLGCIGLGFVIYNWIGYHFIFSKEEKLIIGRYKCANSRLIINSDYTWKITGNNGLSCESGKWNYVMSEDWCYWNIESENMRYKTQIGNPSKGNLKTIVFKAQNLTFYRIE